MDKKFLHYVVVPIASIAVLISGLYIVSTPEFKDFQNQAASILGRGLLTVYDGKSGSLLRGTADHPCLTNGIEVPEGRDGENALRLSPDAYHAPGYSVNCGGQERLDFSIYSYLEFYIKSSTPISGNQDFNIVSYYGTSNTVNIFNYVNGGVVDGNWRLVSIPLSALKTPTYNLGAVDTLYFGTDPQNRVFYVDDIIVRVAKTSTPTASTAATIVSTAPGTIISAPGTISGVVPQSAPIAAPVSNPVVAPVTVPVVAPAVAPVVAPVIKPIVAPVVAKPLIQAVKVADPKINLADLPDTVVPGVSASSDELYNFDEIDMANNYGQWLYADNQNYVSLNFTQKYNPSSVTDLSNYTITSRDDSTYSSSSNGAKKPIKIGYSWHTLYAPTIRLTDLKIAYRIFLGLPSPLKNGKTYTITANNIGINTKPFTFTFDDNHLNNDIKVNQVGYLPASKKIAYVGQYMGTAGPMPFAIGAFDVRDAATDAVVFNGTPQQRNVDTNNTGENVYDLDFSSLIKPGLYYIHIPGVGISYTFRIGSDVYNEVLSNAFHGAYQQRSGTSLTSEYTRFTHGPAHTENGFVMSADPIPNWFRQRFDSEGDTHLKDAQGKRLYYPTSLSGQSIQTNGGHYDAGDYGKYVINGSLFVGDILAAYDAFPDRLMKDDLHVPESGNGIPDLIDEVKWELDWLENMQDPNDGGVFCILKPDGAVEYYENRAMDAVSPSKKLLYPKDTTCTGAYAAALAKAGRSSLIKKYYPEAAARYIVKAEKAWQFLAKTPGYLGWHHYGLKDEFDTDKSMDERVWASIELFGATGSKTYMDFFLAHHNPEYERWGWETLFEASGQADYACAFMTRAGMDASMKNRCVKEVIKSADSHVVDSNNRAYRLSMSDAPLNYRDYTYFFPQERIIQLLIANSLKPTPSYTQTALFNWDYILGANPTSYSYITGIGSKRFRDVVSTQSMYDGIKPPVPGLPVGMGNNFGYLEVYGSSLAQMYPTNATYPLLRQVYDGWNIGVEYTIPELAENIVSAAYFATTQDVTNQPPSSISVTANPASGPTPLAVRFAASAVDPDGKIVRYFWDFDDESYSVQQNPTHVFRDPYKLYRVVLTVTDNDGAEKYKEIDIRTSPAVFNFTSSEYPADANTIALFHFNNSLSDASEHGYQFSLQGGTRMTGENILWMNGGNGQALAFNIVSDTATVDIPAKKMLSGAGATLVAETKIYVDSFISLNIKSSNIFTLTQGDDKAFGLYDAIYVDGVHVTSMAGYDKQKIILTSADIATLMKKGIMQLGTWYNLKLVINNGVASVYVNSSKVAESSIAPDFSSSEQPVRITVGGFKGYMDEIRLSSVVR